MALAQILILIREIDVFYRNSDNEKANDPCTCRTVDLNYNYDDNNNNNNNNGLLNVLPLGGSSPSNHLTDNQI